MNNEHPTLPSTSPLGGEPLAVHTAPTVPRGFASCLIAVAAALVAGLVGFGLGHESRTARSDHERRDFAFHVIGVTTSNEGGDTLNLFFHYRYDDGIRDKDIPDYAKVRDQALGYLAGADLSTNPYWEVLNQHLCIQLKVNFPIEAISCELQVVGVQNPPPHYESGYRSSTDTIGDIDPLVVPAPATTS